jgi:hypothetical protein
MVNAHAIWASLNCRIFKRKFIGPLEQSNGLPLGKLSLSLSHTIVAFCRCSSKRSFLSVPPGFFPFCRTQGGLTIRSCGFTIPAI